MGVDPGLGSPLVCEDKDSTVEVIGLTIGYDGWWHVGHVLGVGVAVVLRVQL